MADKAREWTDKQLEKMEQHISQIYSRAQKEIGEDWVEYMAAQGEKIKILEDAYAEAVKGGEKAEIRKAGKELSKAKRQRTLMNKRYKALTEDVASQISNVNSTAIAYLNGRLPAVYVRNFNQLAETVEQLEGYTFSLVNQNTIKNLVLKQINKAKDIPWIKNQMNSEVLQGIIQGESMDKIAKRLTNVVGMNEKSAIRTARTQVTSAENQGRFDSFKQAEDDGIILHKKWIATHDGRVRDSHAAIDGEEQEVDVPFSNGLMFPGDESGEPAEVYNCRCSMGAVVVGFRRKNER